MLMNKFTFIVSLTVITLAALVLAWFWALPPALTPLLYVHPAGWTDADIVRDIWHFRLVQPEWVSTPPDYDYAGWSLAETFARLGVVFVGWLVSAVLLIRKYRRRNGPSANQSSNQTLQT